jgi:hypothetical protein
VSQAIVWLLLAMRPNGSQPETESTVPAEVLTIISTTA